MMNSLKGIAATLMTLIMMLAPVSVSAGNFSQERNYVEIDGKKITITTEVWTYTLHKVCPPPDMYLLKCTDTYIPNYKGLKEEPEIIICGRWEIPKKRKNGKPYCGIALGEIIELDMLFQ